MKISLSWLRTHVGLPDAGVDHLRDRLTFAGIEVEGVEVRGADSDKIVVAQILESGPHPNADRLSVCRVDDGSGAPRQIVCGAKNYRVGDKVPLALPGAVLPGGLVIKEGKLRDVASAGMMCSGRELGLSDDHAGLLILDPAAPVGRPFREIQPPDVILDLEITPNRPDLLSHAGLARELAALGAGAPLTAPRPEPAAQRAAEAGEVRLDAPDACPFYTARVIRGVRVGPSPDWLQSRLESIGLRPINNIVDVTNFVLHELGSPLHVFDLDRLDGGIVVRHAAPGETIATLDGQVRQLDPADLVIADGRRPVAIAGVMGGADSGVTESTANLLVEAAWFAPGGIRRTARRLGLSSDSSYRFERGVDPQNVAAASALAVRLIVDMAGGAPAPELIVAGAPPQLAGEVALEEDRALQLLGIPDLKRDEMHSVLSALGLERTAQEPGRSTWRIPSHRPDLHRPVDLVEEISRVLGLERVPSRQAGVFVPAQTADRAYDFAMSVRQALVHRGWHEAQTLRLVSQAALRDLPAPGTGQTAALSVRNPLSEDHALLRPGLIPGLMATAALNIRHGQSRLRFFEIGRVFITGPNGATREEERLALLLSGPVRTPAWNLPDNPPADVFDLRGAIEAVPGLAGQALELVPKPIEGWLLGAEVKRGSKTLGWLAQVHPARARELDARHPVFVAELSVSALQQGAQSVAKFSELPRFPGITRDVALEVPADLPNSSLADFFAAQRRQVPLLVGAEVFDVFSDPTGEKIAVGRKSMAWSLTYRSSERTLEAKEVDEAHAGIVKCLVGTLPATVR